MNFLTGQKEAAAQLGLDYTQTDQNTLIKRWLNLSYQDIVGWENWSWLQDRDVVTMETDYTTGTVSVSVAGTTATFSATITNSQANRYIQFSSADDWYKITAHTAGTATATISPAYAQTSALASGTYTIRTFFYSLASTTEKIFNCRLSNTPQYLPIINVDKVDRFDTFTNTTGDVEAIQLWGKDSSGNWTFTPYPFPDSPQLIEFRVFKKATELSSDSDSPIFPDRFTSIWLDRAKAYGYENAADNRSNSVFSRTMIMLGKMKSLDKVGTTENSVIEAIDSGNTGSNFVRFPAQYGNIK